MNQATAYEDNVCEALGCNAEATGDISLDVGNHGIISLRVCDGCLYKFQENKSAGLGGETNPADFVSTRDGSAQNEIHQENT